MSQPNLDHEHILTSIRNTSQLLEREIFQFMAHKKIGMISMKRHGRIVRMPDAGQVIFYKEDAIIFVSPPEMVDGQLIHHINRRYA